MAAAFVKCTRVESTTGNSASGSVSSTAGNGLVSCSAAYESGVSTNNIATSGGGTWTTDTSLSNGGVTPNFFAAAIASCPSATGGAQTITLTSTPSGGSAGVSGGIFEFSGNATASMRDATSPAVATGTGTAAATNALANNTSGAFFVAMASSDTSANPATLTVGGSWTIPTNGKQVNGVSFQASGGAYLIQDGTQTATFTVTSARWAALIAVYKPAAGAASPVLQDLMHNPGFMPTLCM